MNNDYCEWYITRIIFQKIINGDDVMIKELKSKSDYSDLTIGKDYYIIDEVEGNYSILDDKGTIVSIPKYRFGE